MSSIISFMNKNGCDFANNQKSIKNYESQLNFLLIAAENQKDNDLIIINNTEYDLNLYIQALIFTGNILEDPYTKEPHNYDIKSLIDHPNINENNKLFLSNYFNK